MNKTIIGCAIIVGLAVSGRAVWGYTQGQLSVSETSVSQEIVTTTQSIPNPTNPIQEYIPSTAPTGVCEGGGGGCGCGG